MDSEVVYERKILVFFDVLGFKEMVLTKYKNNPEKIEEILTTMHLLAHSHYPSELIVFSDSVINILEFKPHLEEYGQTFSDYLNVIVGEISAIQMKMISLYGVLIRGSIVLGDIRYKSDRNLLFGPALIHAYELESKHSIYPRFILDQKIINLIKEDVNGMDLSRDVDGHYFVDSFKWLVKLEAEKEFLAPIKQKIETEINKLDETKNLGVLSKYHWFLNKIIEREQCNLKKYI
ncbi:hypothetical protein COK05_08910 [Bacillus cereus]|uniref:Guanylate cyclase domain-containing protein n=1 Tax=Bacillus cereus TaxID=1396 RepID=A0A2B2LZB4_BACCE|nr:hypothetical protein [Bacillus cereus]MEB9902819.1 hypothetical protein [Bacillus cereus]MEC0218905.1 hypothetical protein [Bacillus cereus]MEC2860930.1 hypothetical protein [Bacillus cereus]MEC3046014.1 hypothetical protein [Bacillus cereus]PFQ47846.1 hypothetical protein COK05_08910 [Bacillus cereus]